MYCSSYFSVNKQCVVTEVFGLPSSLCFLFAAANYPVYCKVCHSAIKHICFNGFLNE